MGALSLGRSDYILRKHMHAYTFIESPSHLPKKPELHSPNKTKPNITKLTTSDTMEAQRNPHNHTKMVCYG